MGFKSTAPRVEVPGFVCPCPGVGWNSGLVSQPFRLASKRFPYGSPQAGVALILPSVLRGNRSICSCRFCVGGRRWVQVLLCHRPEPESFLILSSEIFSVNYKVTTGEFCLHFVKNASNGKGDKEDIPLTLHIASDTWLSQQIPPLNLFLGWTNFLEKTSWAGKIIFCNRPQKNNPLNEFSSLFSKTKEISVTVCSLLIFIFFRKFLPLHYSPL